MATHKQPMSKSGADGVPATLAFRKLDQRLCLPPTTFWKRVGGAEGMVPELPTKGCKSLCYCSRSERRSIVDFWNPTA